jgi:hypothetical protein
VERHVLQSTVVSVNYKCSTIKIQLSIYVSLVQNGHHHFLIEIYIEFVPMIYKVAENCSFGVKQQSLTHYIIYMYVCVCLFFSIDG